MFDGLYYRARKGSVSKEQGNSFIFIDKNILFCKQLVPVFIPYAQINLLLGEGKAAVRPKEPNSYSTMGISPKLRA